MYTYNKYQQECELHNDLPRPHRAGKYPPSGPVAQHAVNSFHDTTAKNDAIYDPPHSVKGTETEIISFGIFHNLKKKIFFFNFFFSLF